MKTMRGFRVAAALLLSAAMGSAMVGRAQKPMPEGQQSAGPREKHPSDVAFMVQPDNESPEGQEARQKVTLEIAARTLEVVKGKPYSADTTTETVQTLADGNRIVHRTVSKFYRDSDGRTRREQTFGNVDPEHPSPHEVKVFVDDPVSGLAFVLDPASKSADRVQRTRRFLDDRNAEDDGARIMIKSDGEEGGQGTAAPMLIKFRDEHSGDPNTSLALILDDKRDVAKEDLGTRNIEGVDCNGTRTTTTIPAGAIGNEKPISMVRETWYSPAIAAVVESTTEDPRYGKTTYHLTNVQLSEPSRSLFEPPVDFKISVRK
jgi:hypothetical protein